MEHFVEDHSLDIESGHPLVVEDRMHSNQLLRQGVRTEADRALLRPRRTSSPRDANAFEFAGEVLLFDGREHKPQIVVGTFRSNRNAPLTVADGASLRVDEGVDDATRSSVSSCEVTVKRPNDILRGVEEHAVESKVEAPVFSTTRHHRAPVVRYREAHSFAKTRRQVRCELLRRALNRFTDAGCGLNNDGRRRSLLSELFDTFVAALIAAFIAPSIEMRERLQRRGATARRDRRTRLRGETPKGQCELLSHSSLVAAAARDCIIPAAPPPPLASARRAARA